MTSSKSSPEQVVLCSSCTGKGIALDKDLLAPKLWFFLHLASLACIAPFFSVFYKSVGLNSQQIGILGGIRPFINSFGGPFCSFIADITHKHKILLYAGTLLSVVIRYCMLFSDGSFGLICTLLIASEFVGSAVAPLLDNSVLEILGTERTPAYGKQRMFGAMGWGLTAVIVGLLVAHFKNESLYFYSHLIVGLMFFAAIALFPFGGESRKADRIGWSSIFQIIFYSIETFLFFSIVFVMGLAVGIYFNFLFVYLRELGATSFLMGVVLLCNSISDLTFMFFSGRIVGKIGSKMVLHISLLAYALRIFNYSIIPSAWFVLPGELLQGVTWGLAWSAGVNYARSIAPPGLGATTQGVLVGVVGLGNGCGALIGGMVYDSKGAVWTFRATAALMLIALIIFAISNFFTSRYKDYRRLSIADQNGEPMVHIVEPDGEWMERSRDEADFEEEEDEGFADTERQEEL